MARRRRGLRLDGANEWSGKKRGTPSSRSREMDGLFTVGLWREEDGLKNHKKQQQTIDSPPMDGDDTHFWGQKTEETKGPPCPRNRYQVPHDLFIPSTLVVLRDHIGSLYSGPVWKREGKVFPGLASIACPDMVGSRRFQLSRRRGGVGWLFRPDNTGPAACRSCTVSAKCAHPCQLRLATRRGRQGW